MSITENYIEEFGLAFEFNSEEYPDYIIRLDATHNTALVNISKIEYDFKWKPFVAGKIPEEGFIRHETNEFNLTFLHRAIKAINPDEYDFMKGFNKEEEIDNFILMLRKGSYAIMIAPAIEKKGNPLSKLTIEHLIKKAPKSVFVL